MVFHNAREFENGSAADRPHRSYLHRAPEAKSSLVRAVCLVRLHGQLRRNDRHLARGPVALSGRSLPRPMDWSCTPNVARKASVPKRPAIPAGEMGQYFLKPTLPIPALRGGCNLRPATHLGPARDWISHELRSPVAARHDHTPAGQKRRGLAHSPPHTNTIP